jgi:hypothetical protein
MTAKKKANELFLKYHNLWINGNSILAKECALIAVDEIINICLPSSEYGGVITNATIEYWQEVKQEIEKL